MKFMAYVAYCSELQHMGRDCSCEVVADELICVWFRE